MDTKIQIIFIITIIIYLSIIIQLLRKNKLNLKYTLLWIICAFSLLLVTLFPKTIVYISDFLGIKTPINSAFIIAGMFIVMILITITSIVSKLNSSIRVLIQEVAILEKRIRDIEKNNN